MTRVGDYYGSYRHCDSQQCYEGFRASTTNERNEPWFLKRISTAAELAQWSSVLAV